MPNKNFTRVLIANRGEIVVRVARTLRQRGMISIGVYSDIDRDALHVRVCDEAYGIGPAPSIKSYLNQDAIIEAARRSGAEAIHPGYGFLSEKASFAQRVRDEGLVFIGPEASAITAMGDKVEARKRMIAAGVPVVPGTEEPVTDEKIAEAAAKKIGFPLMIKAAAGGGGKGMRLVRDIKDFASSFAAAKREAMAGFGDERVYIERFVEEPHHIEVQVVGDEHGTVLHFFERECSVQRRHQKVIEETPSPFITDKTRKAITEAAVEAAKAVNYTGAGTIECLVDKNQNFYFLEMNTRLQVEHPITEMVTGVDLVSLQLDVAMGKKLPYKQSDIKQRGAAIEARIYAEDPWNNSLPSPGRIEHLSEPFGPGIRVDTGVYEGYTVPTEYDPMISKLVVWAETRREAITRLRQALEQYRLMGTLRSNLPFHRRLIENPRFIEGHYTTQFLDREDIMSIDPTRISGDQLAAVVAVLREELREDIEVSSREAARWRWSSHPGR